MSKTIRKFIFLVSLFTVTACDQQVYDMVNMGKKTQAPSSATPFIAKDFTQTEIAYSSTLLGGTTGYIVSGTFNDSAEQTVTTLGTPGYKINGAFQ